MYGRPYEEIGEIIHIRISVSEIAVIRKVKNHIFIVAVSPL